MDIRNKLLVDGVKNLKEFGYPSVNSDNILTDYLFAQIFKSMLEDNLGNGAQIDSAINAILADIAKIPAPSSPT